jgi:predicted transport protein
LKQVSHYQLIILCLFYFGSDNLAINCLMIFCCCNIKTMNNEVKSPSTKEPITTIAKDSDVVKKVTEEIKVYTEEDHLAAVDDKIKELYSELKSAILSLGKDIEVRPKKKYVSFRRKQAFVGIIFLRSKLKAYLNMELSELKDPMKKARDVKDIGHYSHGNTEVVITEGSEIPYVLSLIKQAYEIS